MTGPRDLAPAVTRAIQILDMLARSPQPVRPIELSATLGVPKSSVHGVCASLIAGGLVERTDSGDYTLGLHLVDLAKARLAQGDIVREFMRLWGNYPEFGQEATLLSEMDGTDVVYLACRNSVYPLGVTFRVGMRLPAAVTATGKAMLSALGDDEVVRLYKGRGPLPSLTSRSVGSLAALRAQLAQARERGYSEDDGETREGMYSIGAPVFSRDGSRVVAGIALCFFQGERKHRRLRPAVDALRQVAADLSRRSASLDGGA